MDLGKGVEYWNSRRVWCLTKPFFSHFVDVVSVHCEALLLMVVLCGMSPQP